MMKSKLKLKNGNIVYLEYVYMNDHLLEIKPCFMESSKKLYMNNGRYELENGGYFIIKDTKIDYVQYES